MKKFKLLLWFVVGCLLGGVVTFASAETIPATVTTQPMYVSVNSHYSGLKSYPEGALATCQHILPAGTVFTTFLPSTSTASTQTVLCRWTRNGSPEQSDSGTSMAKQVAYQCPANQNWTLSGSNCTRPDCVAPNVRDSADGVCKPPEAPCPVFSGSLPGTDSLSATKPDSCQCPAGTKWFPYNGCRKLCDSANIGAVANAGFDLAIAKGAATGCFAGCEVQHGAGAYDILKDGSYSAQATYTGWACAGTGVGAPSTADGQPQPDSSQLDPTKKHPPKCGSGEGVITSSSGNVLCLPAGTPNTSTPKVESSKKTETFPDSSTKTTETTKTTDPNTGATSTSTSSTSTGGQSGEAGTTTSTENGTGKDGDGDGDGDGECDPTLHFCGGPATDKLYTKKEKTMESVFQQFKTTISGSGLGSATTGFFNVSAPGGSCPSWSVQVPYLNVTLSGVDIFCGGAILAALQGAGAVMLALATYIAFTWAFL